MLVFRLALRALAWRASASATIFAVALVGITAAALGPIYLRGVDDTVLAERLLDAPQVQRDVRITHLTVVDLPGVDWSGGVRRLARQAADPRWFDQPVYSEEAQVVYHGSVRYRTQLVAIDDLCRHLVVVSGNCVADNATDTTVISVRTARSQHLTVGSTVRPLAAANDLPVPLRVVGIVEARDPHGPFWQPWDYFNAQPSYFDSQLPRLDSFFVSHRALSTRILHVAQTVAANVHLRPESVRAADISALRARVTAVAKAAAIHHTGYGLTDTVLGSQLLSVLDDMHREMSLARTLIILPTAQLVLLAIVLLYSVVARTAAAHGPEVALAKLRGRRPRSVLLQGVLQPIVLIVLAAPIAAVLAWLVMRALASHLLGRPADIGFPPSALWVVLAATCGGVVAAVVAARRIVVSPVSALLRRGTDASGASLGLALADVAAAALAVAGLVELIAGGVLDSGKTDPLSALAPTLLGIAASIGVVRLLPWAGRLLMRWTRDSPRLASFLAIRQIVRRPAGARVLLLVGVALALATFAVTNWSVARTNREARALNQAGAATVLHVNPGPHVADLRKAVDAADPGGHSMAVAFVQADRSTPLIAVDSKRFAGVAAWRSNYADEPLAEVLRTIAGPARTPIAFNGDRLRFTVDLAPTTVRQPRAVVYVTRPDHHRLVYDLGTLRPGRAEYEASVGSLCSDGCRITGFAVAPRSVDVDPTRIGTHPGQVRFAVAAEEHGADGGWHPVEGFADPHRWTRDGDGSVQIGGSEAVLTARLGQSGVSGLWPELASAEVPDHLPAVLASGTAELYPGEAVHDASSFGIDGRSQPIDGKVEAVTLPEIDRYGAMVDLGLALDAMQGPASANTRFEVWVAPSAPGDLRSRLAGQGVTVTGVVHAATFRSALDHTGPAFADQLFLVAAVAATLLAIGAAVFAGVTTARRRGYELAALAAAGVSTRVLRRATALEYGILLGLGLLVGLVAGVGGSALALPSTPFFVDEKIGPPVDHGLPFGLLAVLSGCVAAAFVLTSVIVAWLTAAQASPSRLREAQQ